MKLRNKLIPLLSVVTATGVVAPIATSCGAGVYIKDIEMVDITHNYVPTIDKAKKLPEGQQMTDVDAQDLYFEHLAANPEILAQDVIKYQADYLPERIEYIEYYDPSGVKSDSQKYIAKNVTAKVGVDNVSFKKVKYIKEDGTESFFYALSCDIQYAFTFSALRMDGNYQMDGNLNFKASLKDIPTEVVSKKMYNPNVTSKNVTKRWWISNTFTDNKKLDAVPGWSYTFARNDAISETTINEHGIKSTTSNDYVKSGVLNRKDQIADLIKEGASAYYDEFLVFESYHLSDVNAITSYVPIEFNLNTNGNIPGTISSTPTSFRYGFNVILNMFKIGDEELLEAIKSDKYTTTMYFGYSNIEEAAAQSSLKARETNSDNYSYIPATSDSTKLNIYEENDPSKRYENEPAYLNDRQTQSFVGYNKDFSLADNIVYQKYWFITHASNSGSVPASGYNYDTLKSTDSFRFKLPSGTTFGFTAIPKSKSDQIINESVITTGEITVEITVNA